MDREDIVKAYGNFYSRGRRGFYLAFQKNPEKAAEVLVFPGNTKLALYKQQCGAVLEIASAEQIEEWYKS